MLKKIVLISVLMVSAAHAETKQVCNGDTCLQITTTKNMMEEHRDRWNSTRFFEYTMSVRQISGPGNPKPTKVNFFVTCDTRNPQVTLVDDDVTEKVNFNKKGIVTDVWNATCGKVK